MLTPPEFNNRFAAWLRIEPRCRQDNFARGIQVRTADPLWMLTRQWQLGEFQAEDAGSPIKVEMRYSTQSIDCLKLGDQTPQPMPVDVPLETIVEQERNTIDYRERVRIGQEFERRLRAKLTGDGDGGDVDDFINNLKTLDSFRFPRKPETPIYELDKATQRFVNFMRGRVIDGLCVVEEEPVRISRNALISQTDFEVVCQNVKDWYGDVCRRPVSKNSPAWQPEKLDFRFEANNYPPPDEDCPKELQDRNTKLVAPDYRNGEVDWYTFSVNDTIARGPWKAPSDPKLNPIKSTPTRIQVTGTSPRWWAFEDANTDFGAMDVAKPDLAKLLLMEFVLIYGDDWFSMSAPVAIGSLVRIDELKVWNVFGEVTSIGPARQVYPEGTDWDASDLENVYDRPVEKLPNLSRFDLFTLSGPGPKDPGLDVRLKTPILQLAGKAINQRFELPTRDSLIAKRLKSQLDRERKFDVTSPRPILFISPVTGFRQESRPLDEVRFLRDEGANMMWGVENTVPNGLGRPISGFDAQRERYERWRNQLAKLLIRLERLLEFGSPTDEQRKFLKTMANDLQNHITDLSPYANPTPSQNNVPRYRLATTVPDNWIPFIPVRRGSLMSADYAAIQFRRAKMLRNSDHSKMDDIITITLTQFLDLHKRLENNLSMSLEDLVTQLDKYLTAESLHPFASDGSIPSMSRLLALDENAMLFLNEETVPRAGLRVQLTKQRVRWHDGTTHVWLGKKVLTGRGEGSSGLRFDMVKE